MRVDNYENLAGITVKTNIKIIKKAKAGGLVDTDKHTKTFHNENKNI